MTFECADAYFQYGSALLEQARLEDNLLSHAIKGSEQVLGEESDESIHFLIYCSSFCSFQLYWAFCFSDSDDDGDQEDGNAEAPAGDSFVIPEKLDDGERERISEAVIDAMCATEAKTVSTAACSESCAVDKSEKAPESSTVEKTTTNKSEAEPAPTCEKPAESGNAPATPVDSTSAPAGTETEAQSTQTKETEASEDERGLAGAGEAAEAVESESAPSEDADDVPTLQLAWEMLECAKLLYNRRITALESGSSSSNTAGATDDAQKTEDDLRKFKLRVADCHYRLAEIGLEKGMLLLFDLNKNVMLHLASLVNSFTYIKISQINVSRRSCASSGRPEHVSSSSACSRRERFTSFG